MLLKAANGKADLFHQIGNGDAIKTFLAETSGCGTRDTLISFDFV